MDTLVCASCIEEEFLSRTVEDDGSEGLCSYCGRSSKTISLRDLAPLICAGVEAEFNDAADENVPYESREGGYQWPIMSVREVLEAVGFTPDSEELVGDVATLLPDYAWVARNPASVSETEGLHFGWEEFSEAVKHEVRYLLFPPQEADHLGRDRYEVRPEDMLERLGELVSHYGLFSTLEEGVSLFRVRIHDPSETPTTFSELGPPPHSRARFSNRMSPAGISMFYAALDEETASAETPVKNHAPAVSTFAQFELEQGFRVLNLVDIPDVPSSFDESGYETRPGLSFLHRFRQDLIAPVEKDGREHIEYIPSQIVTEFFRYRYHDPEGGVQGVLYPSSRINGVACVLFISHEQCNSSFPGECPLKLLGYHHEPIE